jgi:outer membrane murein-binding lipoprotein Lpp
MNERTSPWLCILRPSLPIVLLVILALALAGCASATRQKIDVAADYVRCSVNSDYDAMSKVVSKAARPYCYAMSAAPPSAGNGVDIAKETREGDALIFELAIGPTSTFLRLSPPKDDAPDEVIVESWNRDGARSTGTLTVAEENDELVVTHVDEKPIEDVLAVGSGGL